MARINVNPTRMELSKLKKSLATAMKGHKLLKDKRDELMRQFLETVREAKTLREKTEQEIIKSQSYLERAAALMGEKELQTALLLPKQSINLDISSRNVMSVLLPVFSQQEVKSGDMCSYGFAHTSADLDTAIKLLCGIREELLHLAELEKSAALMAGEIERTRRRVNALEYIMIPDYQETIRYITMKLDENERSNNIRLLKVKDMIIEQNIKNHSS